MLPMIVGNTYSTVSNEELERRRLAAQEVMVRRGVDCIILAALNQDVGSAVKYFSDIPGSEFGSYILMPHEGKSTYFSHGPEGLPAVRPPQSWNFENTYAFPYLASLPFTDGYIPMEIVKWIKHRNYSRIGLYRRQHLSFLIIDAIRESIPGCEFANMDDEIDYIQAIKSGEEIECIKRGTALHDDLYAACKAFVRPGRLEREVINDIIKLALDNNCESYNIMIGSGCPIGRSKRLLAANNRIESGDVVDLLVEVAVPGGYFGEVGRIWSIGEPSPELIEAFNNCIEIQEHIASIAKPGVKACDLMLELHKYQEAHGYEKERRLFAHSQGFDVVSRPCLMLGENMEIQENMIFAIHPSLGNNRTFAQITDNFLITKDGGQLLSNTPRKIFIVE